MSRMVGDSLNVAALNRPRLVARAVEEESFNYRRHLMNLSNLLRLVVVLCALLFAPAFFEWRGASPMIWNGELALQKEILLLGMSYAFCLVFLSLKGELLFSREFVFIINALIDISFASIFFIVLNLELRWQFIVPFFILTLLLSLLSLSFVQSIFYALFIYPLSVVIFLLWVSGHLALSEKGEFLLPPWLFFLNWQESYWQPLLKIAVLFFLLAVFIATFGYLASNSRERGILAKINQRFYEQSRLLNESIIAEMPSGLLVVNQAGEIISINRRACQLFRIKSSEEAPLALSFLSPMLMRQFFRWQDLQHNSLQPLNLKGASFTATFTSLPISGYNALVMISLESLEDSYQRVRETRLASLGRLTASIAHEIRNPLGSIQSANELLMERSGEDKDMILLSKKILNNSKRINAIISDILDLFSEKPTNAQIIVLNDFLLEFREAIRSECALENLEVALDLQATEGLSVSFDPSHLNQILHNLFLNSVRHSDAKVLRVWIETRLAPGGRSVLLDVRDNGKGVEKSLRDKIFEPFFSSRQGPGLGLYLVREMCLANQAHIFYVAKERGACFRIIMDCYSASRS